MQINEYNKEMNRISVVLAVYNEEENLARCLNSVKNLAWEIVVVDGGSTDDTIRIAKKYGARVIETDNPPNFHINKNKAIDAARGDWILQLDADEQVTEDLAQEILEAITSLDVDGYWIPRLNLFLNHFLKKGGQYPDYTLRLYRKGKGRLPAKDVHEQAIVEGKTKYLHRDLLHLRDKDFGHYIEGLNRYTSLMAMEMKDRGEKINFKNFIYYFLFKPTWWFLKTYIRHKGFMDGFAGFVFSLFSSLRFPLSYIKLWNTK